MVKTRKILFFLLLLFLVPGLVSAEQARFKVNIKPPPATPANIETKVNFNEPSGNRALDADEEASLLVKITNNGPGVAYGVVVKINALSGGHGVLLPEPVRFGDIEAGKTIEEKISLSGSSNVETGKLRLQVTALEINGFDANPVPVVLVTRKFQPPELVLADMGIDDQSQNGQIEPMEVVEITARVKNVGQGTSVNTLAKIELGETVFPAMGSKLSFELGDIGSGKWKDIQFTILTNKRIKSGEQIPVTLSVSEKKAGNILYVPLDLVMNVPHRKTSDVVFAAREMERPAEQDGPGLSVDIDRDIPEGQKASRYDIAVIIGNKNYSRAGVSKVDFAHRDLGVLKEYLVTTFGFDRDNIIEERDATKGVFEMLFGSQTKIRGRLADYVKPGKSRVFIYYTGHGAPDIDTGEGYFVPVDADPDYIASTGYSLSLFYRNLKNIKAKEMVIVIDACFSGRTQDGMLFKNISPSMLKVRETSAGLKHGAVLASSSGDQVSTWYPDKRHSLFTYYFLKGIRGEADSDANKEITVAELESWLDENIPYMARRLAGKNQNPTVEGKRDLVMVKLK